MNPTSKACEPLRSAIALSLASALIAGCAASTLPDARRRSPDGVAIDPVSAPPAPRDRGDVADGLVTLRTPLGADRAIAAVEDFFRKVVQEDGDGLEALFTRDAIAITSLTGSGQTPQASTFWQGRFRKLDYTKLAGEVLYRDAEISVYRTEDVIDAPPHPAIRAESIASGDVVVRVPIHVARVGADRLFGDEIILWLRRDGDRFRIYRALEDFQLN